VAADPNGVGLTAADVRSTASGSVFYAEQPALGLYWAIASFVPSPLARSRGGSASDQAFLVQFRYRAVFDKAPGHPWTYVGEARQGPCSGPIPSPVLAVWDLCAGVGS
jgi:hypothetical protein